MRVEDFSDYLVGLRLSGKTISRYVRWIRDADEWMAARGWSLDDATATMIASWATERVSNSHASRVQAAAALAHWWDMTGRPRPPRAVRVPPKPEMVCRAVSEDQARDVVKVATGWWMEGTIVLAGMYLALRRFEIATMAWDRFSDDLGWYRVTGKFDKTATLPVHPHLASELHGRRDGSPWVFPSPRKKDRPIHPATVWDWTQRVGRAAGVPHLEPHELRHTSLATANDRTQDLRSVQTFARHANPAVTAGYTRTTRKRLREVSNSLDYI